MKEDIKVCKYCGKVDCSQEHEDNCSYEFGKYKEQEDEIMWK